MTYDPNSDDSVFTRIMEKLEKLDKQTDRIEVQVRLTNGRVTGLERWKDVISAKVATIAAVTSVVVGGLVWVLERLL